MHYVLNYAKHQRLLNNEVPQVMPLKSYTPGSRLLVPKCVDMCRSYSSSFPVLSGDSRAMNENMAVFLIKITADQIF